MAKTANLNAPLLLLPYRLETRFVDAAEQYVSVGDARGPALLVRICPDQISIDAFDPRLTVAESAAGAAFWSNYQSALANNGDAKGAWSALVASVGAPRAAYLVQACNPQSPPSPPPGVRRTSWEIPPVIRGLPDYWIIECDDGSGVPLRTASGAVKSDLAIGPDPHSTTAVSPKPEQMSLGTEIRWMADFNEAIRVGMGVCIGLTPAQRAEGFRQIFAYGVRAQDDGSATFTTLLNHHRFSDGFGFVAQGTPTKNTADAKSGVSSTDLGDADSYAALFPAGGKPLTSDFAVAGAPSGALTPVAAPLPGNPYTAWTDGKRAAWLLGIDADTNFGQVDGAQGRDQQDAIDMAVALWPATFGYFIRNMMAGSIPWSQRAAFEQWLQGLFISFVRACGFLPAVRVGSTPYGLAVSADWQQYEPKRNEGGSEPRLLAFLKSAYALWERSQPAVPNVMVTGAAADAAFAATLAMDAASVSFNKQWVLGPSFFESILGWEGMAFPQVQMWQAMRAATVAATCAAYGIAEPDPLVGFTIDFGEAFPSSLPFVQAGALSASDALTDNYIAWLSSASISDIQQENYPGGSVPNSLLYLLLRQSVLRGYVNLAADSQLLAGTISAQDAIEQEMVNIARPAKTPWTILDTAVPGQGATTYRQYLYGIAQSATTHPDPGYPALNQLFVSLKNLASRPSASLDRIARETLDLFSFRLDAWLTWIANSLLAAQRSASPNGLVLGGYSWVENVVPDATQRALESQDEIAAVQALDAALAAAGVPTPAAAQPKLDSGGFIHAPSNAQAATAAILRSGYLSHKGTAAGTLLNIDLSSQRVSRALWLLEGVRQGQSLGALLGFQFEQQLINNGFGDDVLAFRNAYPLITGKLSPVSTAADLEGGPNVVDGTALVRAWQNNTLASGLPVSDAEPCLAQLEDLLGSLSDLGIAESVFQIVRGNPDHSGAVMNAISQGDHPPAVQVANTPRTGRDLAHRLGILFTAAPALKNHWTTSGGRATVDPWLNAWVSSQLPDAATVQIRIVPGAPAGGPTPAPFTIALSSLGLSALDALTLGNSADTPQMGELELRLLAAAAANPGLPAGSPLPKLAYSDASFTAADMTVPQFLVVARAVRDLVSRARALTVDDLSLPTGKGRGLDSGAIDLPELAGRISSCVSAMSAAQVSLQAAADALRNAIRNNLAGQAALAATLRAAMLAAAGYTISGCLSRWPDASDLATTGNSLLSRAEIAAATMRSRLSAIPGAPSAVTLARAGPPATTQLTLGFTVGGVKPPAKAWSPIALPTDLLTQLPKSIVDGPRLAAGAGTVILSGLAAAAWPGAAGSYTIDGVAVLGAAIDDVQNTVTLTVPQDVAPLQALTIVVSGVALTAGNYRIAVCTSSDPVLAQSPAIAVGAGSPLSLVRVNSQSAAGGGVDQWSVTFTPAAALPGAQSLTLSGAPQTQWSANAADYTVNGAAVTAAPVLAGNRVTLSLPSALPGTTSATVVAANLRNPAGGALALSLDAGGAPAVSAVYTLQASAVALEGAAETLLGKSTMVLPRFSPSNGATLAASVVTPAQGATPDAIWMWMQQLTHVRPAADRLDRVNGIAQMLAASQGSPPPVPPSWVVLQQPYDAADVWIGTASSPAAATTPGRVACVLELPSTQTLSFNDVAGLYIDEWTERIPDATQTTALTFHYEEPTARAPQALLLAVNQGARAWSWGGIADAPFTAGDNIVTVLKSTLALAKIRAVDPLSLKDGGQFLPMVYMPANLGGASTGASRPEALS